MKPRLALLGVTALGALLLPACASRYYVEQEPLAPPPPVARGYVGVAPGPGYVWIEGAWDWRGGRNYWTPGRWVRPPRSRAIWLPGHWVRERRGSYWRPGYWR